jgi:hypothetical protein
MNHRVLAIIITIVSGALPALAAGQNGITPEGSDELPITDVVLFSTGVGYFQRSGVVEENKTVDMFFESAAVNDLLKSLVLQDFDGGTISSVNYA